MDAMSDTTESEKVVSVHTAIDSSFAEVSIADTGSGSPPDVAEKVFEPFYSTKKEGMGMGLSIVRTILEGHNGEVRAENSYHGGALFRVRLPLA